MRNDARILDAGVFRLDVEDAPPMSDVVVEPEEWGGHVGHNQTLHDNSLGYHARAQAWASWWSVGGRRRLALPSPSPRPPSFGTRPVAWRMAHGAWRMAHGARASPLSRRSFVQAAHTLQK